MFSTPVVTLNTQQLISHWAKWPSGAVNDSREEVDFDFITEADETLVRTINSIRLQMDPPSLDTINWSFGFGVIAWPTVQPTLFNLVTLDSNTELPGPLSSPEEDWVWRIHGSGRAVGDVGFAIGADVGNGDFLGMTSRAMRKLPIGTGLLQICEVEAEGEGFETTGTFSFVHDVRMLFKDP